MKKIRKKILPKYFKEVKAEIKDFEIRKDDSDYEVDDILILQEWVRFDNPIGYAKGAYTGEVIEKRIKYKITHDEFPEGIQEGYCILGLEDIEENIKGRIKALVRTDGFNIFDDEGFICGTLGVNKEKLKGLIHKVNDSIQLRNIDLAGISKRDQYDKFIEEQAEFRGAFREFTFTRKEKDKFHAIEEFYDMLQSALGMLQLEGTTAEEVMQHYPLHEEKLKHRPRSKEE